jgi:hypothetical protein
MAVACDQRSLEYDIHSLTGKVWGVAEMLITKGCASCLTIGGALGFLSTKIHTKEKRRSSCSQYGYLGYNGEELYQAGKNGRCPPLYHRDYWVKRTLATSPCHAP